ncbi:MAG: hypothetical protein C4338_01560, partial [Rhodanobacteraceae bacterium]
MQFRKGVVVAAALIAMSAAVVQAAPQPDSSGGASAQEVRDLLSALNIPGAVVELDARTAAAIQRAVPCAPAATVQAAFNSPTVQQDQINRLIPIYQSHLSGADVRGLLNFFRSPLGVKWLQASSSITQQAIKAGQQANQQRLQQMTASLKQQGVLNAQGQSPANSRQPAVPAP